MSVLTSNSDLGYRNENSLRIGDTRGRPPAIPHRPGAERKTESQVFKNIILIIFAILQVFKFVASNHFTHHHLLKFDFMNNFTSIHMAMKLLVKLVKKYTMLT